MSSTRNTRRVVTLGPDGWTESRGRRYRYLVYVTGGDSNFAATAAEVPGVTATGGSEDEALAAIRETLLGMLRRSKASGIAMSRGEVVPPAGAVVRGVFIDLNAE